MGLVHPENLILACGAAVLLSALLWAVWRKPRFAQKMGMGRPEIVIRALIILLLLLALCGPYLNKLLEEGTYPALLDISESVDVQAGEALLNQLRSLENGIGPVEVFPFAGEISKAGLPPARLGSFQSVRDSFSKLNLGETDLSAALMSGLAQAQGSLLVLSDGYETKGDSQGLLTSIGSGGTKIFPLVPALPFQHAKQFRISQLYAPLIAPAQKSVDLRVSVLNTTDEPQSGRLEVKHDGRPVYSEKLTVPAHTESLVITQSEPSQEGIKEITAELGPEDKRIAPSLERSFLSGEARQKVLLISGAEEDRRLLETALKGQAYQLNSLVAGVRLNELPDLQTVSSVILNNVAVSQLPYGAAAVLEKYVASGGGFIMLGGNRSFGLGGYINTPVAQLLPLELVPPRTEEKRLDVAVELVIDKSRSMGEEDKLEYSKEAAREVVRNLKDNDFIGVIGFDESPFEVLKLGRVIENRGHALERIGRLFPDRRTNLFPSMEEARRRLEGVSAGRKHMIILTDGKLPDASQAYVEMVKQMRLVGITVSTVMIGAEYDFGFLQSLSEFGGGAYYQTNNPSNLPKIFVQDVKARSGEQTLKEETEFMVRPGPAGVKSVSVTAYPPLKGYVETRPRKEADLELVVMSQDKAEPLLASWKYGQGRALAFTSDANGRWSANWAEWPRYTVFWSDLLDSARGGKEAQEETLRYDLRQFVEHGSLMLDLSVYNEIGNVPVSASVLLPDSSTRELEFVSLAKGHYQAALERAVAGKYEIRAKAGTHFLTPAGFYLSGELFGEKKGQGFNLALLERLGAVSGGKINPTPEDLRSVERKRVGRRDLSWVLITLGLILVLFEILQREVLWRYRFTSNRKVRGKVRTGVNGR
jgi:Ca-activated chloride channel homolog